MAAGITDYFNKASSGAGTRPDPAALTAQKGTGASSITVDSTAGWATDTAVHFTMYQVNAAGTKIASSQTDWKGIVTSSTSITGLTLKGGTDAVYPIGAKVVATPTAAWADDHADGALVHSNQNGTLKDDAVTTDSILSQAVTTAKLANASVTAGKIAADAVNAPKLKWGFVRSRQGGSSTVWATPGTTDYDTTAVDCFTQVGSFTATGSDANHDITFDEAYTYAPLVFATPIGASGVYPTWYVVTVTTTGFTFREGSNVVSFNWMAIGV